MISNTSDIEILGTSGQAIATDADEVAVMVTAENPVILAGIAYAFRTYWIRNPETGTWRAKSSFSIDRLQEDEENPGSFSRDWYKPVTDSAQQKIYRAAIEAAEAVSQDRLDAGLIYRLAQKVVRAKEAVTRHEAEYDAAKNLLAEAEAQLADGVLS